MFAPVSLCLPSVPLCLWRTCYRSTQYWLKLGYLLPQRAPAVGAKIWCLFFCWSRSRSESVTYLLIVRSRGAQFEQALRCRLFPISMRFAAFFSQVIPLSKAVHSSHIRRQVASQFSRNCSQKLRKVSKSAEKFVRTTSYRQLKYLKKIPPSSLGGICRCAPI